MDVVSGFVDEVALPAFCSIAMVVGYRQRCNKIVLSILSVHTGVGDGSLLQITDMHHTLLPDLTEFVGGRCVMRQKL